jgi:hypothetical protein
MLSVIMLSVIMPRVCTLTFVMLNIIMLRVSTLTFGMLSYGEYHQRTEHRYANKVDLLGVGDMGLDNVDHVDAVLAQALHLLTSGISSIQKKAV